MKVFRHAKGRGLGALPSVRRIERILRSVFRHEKAGRAGELNVIFVDDRHIASINRKFLNHRGTTDVIAFPYESLPGVPDAGLSGDIYICTAEARRNAKAFGAAYEAELVRLIVHGTLHLLGHDDHAPKKRRIMWAAQEKLVARELAR